MLNKMVEVTGDIVVWTSLILVFLAQMIAFIPIWVYCKLCERRDY